MRTRESFQNTLVTSSKDPFRCSENAEERVTDRPTNCALKSHGSLHCPEADNDGARETPIRTQRTKVVTAAMKRGAKPPKRRRTTTFNAPVLLTAVKPYPKCSLLHEYGTFCLTGTAEMKPDIKSLSVLKGRHEVSLFGKSAQGLFPNLARDVLIDHLVRVLDHTTEASITDFLRQSKRLFQQFVACIKDHENAKVEVTPSWTLSYAEELMTQLENLERVYGRDAVKDLSDDLLKVTLQYQDSAGRSHVLSLVLSPDTFPQSCPACTCELPIKSGWRPSWRHGVESMSSNTHHVESDEKEMHLKDKRVGSDDDDNGFGLIGLYRDFARAVCSYQDLWNELDDLDASTWILEPSVRPPCRSVWERRIALTEATSIVIELDCKCPRAPPKTVRWIGPDTSCAYRKKFEQYMSTSDSGWSMHLSIKDNLERCLGIRLPSPPLEMSEVVLECSICYVHDLPTENGSSEFPNNSCENLKCGRHYHESCLRDWLHSLPSSRKSFDRLVGSCPYCHEPISAALQQR